jgi:hypothetical protein
MQAGDDAMMVVRAELCERLAVVRRSVERCRGRDTEAQAESIRTIAEAYGLTPVARLAEALKRAACHGGGEGACPPSMYLARLQDAIGCERRDEEAGQAMLASVSVRLCA